jgi:hypothetical protein
MVLFRSGIWSYDAQSPPKWRLLNIARGIPAIVLKSHPRLAAATMPLKILPIVSGWSILSRWRMEIHPRMSSICTRRSPELRQAGCGQEPVPYSQTDRGYHWASAT